MLGDAHSTNWAKLQFFLNQNNPTNCAARWATKAYYLYTDISGFVTHQPVSFTRFGFPRSSKELQEPKYASQTIVQIPGAKAVTGEGLESDESDQSGHHPLLPPIAGSEKMITQYVDGKDVEELYYPPSTLSVGDAKRTLTFGAARVNHRRPP